MNWLTRRSLVFLTLLSAAMLLSPYVSNRAAHAASLFSLQGYIAVGNVSGTCVGTALSTPKGAPVCTTNPKIAGLAVDEFNNVLYALDVNNSRLVRIDGSTDRKVDAFALPASCVDPRRPAVSSVYGTVKVYIGCEGNLDDSGSTALNPYILVLQVAGGRFGTVSDIKHIALKVPGIPDLFEPKTERINNKFALGMLYVVGDEITGSALGCVDPAFAISTASDSIVATNTTLGATSASDCGTAASHTGINDVAIGPFGVYWFNEDDHIVYRTYHSDLRLLSVSMPVPDPFDEDEPKFGAVSGSNVLATAPEAYSASFNEGVAPNGGIYRFNGTTLLSSIPTPGFEAGPVATAGTFSGEYFLVTNMADDSTILNCTPSCVRVYNVYDQSLLQSLQLPMGQSDVVFNPLTRKGYLSLNENSNGQDIAVIHNP